MTACPSCIRIFNREGMPRKCLHSTDGEIFPFCGTMQIFLTVQIGTMQIFFLQL